VLAAVRGQGETLSIIVPNEMEWMTPLCRTLEGGADDYITKPFRFEELLAQFGTVAESSSDTRTKETTLRVSDTM